MFCYHPPASHRTYTLPFHFVFSFPFLLKSYRSQGTGRYLSNKGRCIELPQLCIWAACMFIFPIIGEHNRLGIFVVLCQLIPSLFTGIFVKLLYDLCNGLSSIFRWQRRNVIFVSHSNLSSVNWICLFCSFPSYLASRLSRIICTSVMEYPLNHRQSGRIRWNFVNFLSGYRTAQSGRSWTYRISIHAWAMLSFYAWISCRSYGSHGGLSDWSG